jgi:hypothetical protein
MGNFRASVYNNVSQTSIAMEPFGLKRLAHLQINETHMLKI